MTSAFPPNCRKLAAALLLSIAAGSDATAQRQVPAKRAIVVRLVSQLPLPLSAGYAGIILRGDANSVEEIVLKDADADSETLLNAVYLSALARRLGVASKTGPIRIPKSRAPDVWRQRELPRAARFMLALRQQPVLRDSNGSASKAMKMFVPIDPPLGVAREMKSQRP